MKVFACLAALFVVAARATEPGVFSGTPPSPLGPLAPGEEVAPPAWLPEDAFFEGAVGRTNVLWLEARWLFGPVAGRPAYARLAHTNVTGHAFRFERAQAGYADRRGLLLLLVAADGSRQVVPGFPEEPPAVSAATHCDPGEAHANVHRLSPALAGQLAGAAGASFAYVDHEEPYLFWAESAVLPAPVPSPEPATAGTNEWAQLVASWAAHGMGYPARPYEVLSEFPEFASFFPGVVLDAALPEAFRIEFAERMPGATYDPAVFAFVTNAVDKTAPLVVAALRVLSRVSGTTPEQKAAVDAMGDAVYAMSQDAQHPLVFRLHAAHRFRSRVPYKEFRERTEPEFKLLAAHELRSAQGADFSNALRAELRAGLTTLSTDTTPFVAGPLAGKYPENATVGQVAAIILADLEAKWAAEPSWKD